MVIFFLNTQILLIHAFSGSRTGESISHWHMQPRTSGWFANSNLQYGYRTGIPISQCSYVPVSYIQVLMHQYNFYVFFSSFLGLCSSLSSLLSEADFLLQTGNFYALLNSLLSFSLHFNFLMFTFVLQHFLVKPVTVKFSYHLVVRFMIPVYF